MIHNYFSPRERGEKSVINTLDERMKKRMKHSCLLGLVAILACLGTLGCGTFRSSTVETVRIPYNDFTRRAGHYALFKQRVSVRKTGKTARYKFWSQACWFKGHRYWIVVKMDHEMNCIVKASVYQDTAIVPGYNMFGRAPKLEEEVIEFLKRDDYWMETVQQAESTVPSAAALSASPDVR